MGLALLWRPSFAHNLALGCTIPTLPSLSSACRLGGSIFRICPELLHSRSALCLGFWTMRESLMMATKCSTVSILVTIRTNMDHTIGVCTALGSRLYVVLMERLAKCPAIGTIPLHGQTLTDYAGRVNY